MAAQDECPEVLDPLEGRCRQQVQVHLQQHVLTLHHRLAAGTESGMRDCQLTAKSVVMVATCMILGSVVVPAAPPASSRASRFL